MSLLLVSFVIHQEYQDVYCIYIIERLCSSGVNDQRVSVLFQINDNRVTLLNMNMTFTSNSQQSSWGIATFMLITGFCDASCARCRHSF